MARKPRQPSNGRQKIEIVKIPIRNHLQVTFSKRRSGLFKKASELCTLCGAEVALVVFSPAGKVFSFGHPDVDTLIDRFLARNRPQQTIKDGGGTLRLVEAQRSMGVSELNAQLTQALAHLEAEKKRGEALEEVRKIGRSQFWWEAPIEELSFQQLLQLRHHLEELKRDVVKQANRLLVEASSTAPFSTTVAADGFGLMREYYSSHDHGCDHTTNRATGSLWDQHHQLTAAARTSVSRAPNCSFSYGHGLFWNSL